MIRRLFKVLVVVGLFLLLLIVGGWLMLRPPVLEVPSQERLIFSNVTVINPGLDRRDGQILTAQGGQIVSITVQNPNSRDSEATSHFAGAYVLPGLIDMHAHHTHDWELFGLLFLAHGVTTVRDVDDFNGIILEKQQQIQRGAYPGPRIFACGPILDGDPPWSPTFRVVRNATEARTIVEELAETGVNCVKVYWRLSREALTAIRATAAHHGLLVVGHVPFATPFEEAHLGDVQHLTGVPVVGGHGGKTQQAQFAEWVAAWQAVDAARLDFIVRTSVEQGVIHTPTLVVWERMSRLPDYPKLLADPAVRLLPRWYHHVLWQPEDAWLPTYVGLGKALPKMKDLVRRLHKAGVRIHVGSDPLNPFVVPGAGFHEELHHLVEAGLTPEEVWVAGTRWAGETLGELQLGTLQVAVLIMALALFERTE